MIWLLAVGELTVFPVAWYWLRYVPRLRWEDLIDEREAEAWWAEV